MATVTVIYPSGHKFDLDYYLNTHMPLVAREWGSAGLTGYEVVQFTEGGAYQIQAVLKWTSLDAWNKASKDVVLGDIPNFTTAPATLLTGEYKQAITL
ncbi:unnamed protein product [Clonostachys byssicola]|uniref:Ethyl tert-butyl ether degradation EthD n=1 Tax=Clonostachys byssicola TaxID=160290 RepID=A0A9N9UTJ3_9HYPO|nr:unnamed protein product [Clonostachys byssicola]